MHNAPTCHVRRDEEEHDGAPALVHRAVRVWMRDHEPVRPIRSVDRDRDRDAERVRSRRHHDVVDVNDERGRRPLLLLARVVVGERIAQAGVVDVALVRPAATPVLDGAALGAVVQHQAAQPSAVHRHPVRPLRRRDRNTRRAIAPRADPARYRLYGARALDRAPLVGRGARARGLAAVGTRGRPPGRVVGADLVVGRADGRAAGRVAGVALADSRADRRRRRHRALIPGRGGE